MSTEAQGTFFVREMKVCWMATSQWRFTHVSSEYSGKEKQEKDDRVKQKQRNVMTIQGEDRTITTEIKIDNGFKIL